MRVAVLVVTLSAVSACTFDKWALGEWPMDSGAPDQFVDANYPEAGQGDRIPADTGREAGQSDAGSDAQQDDAQVQSDAQTDGETQTDAQPQSDAEVQADTLTADPCVGLVADFASNYGYIDHCTDRAGHTLSLNGSKVYAPDGICRIVCWTQPTETQSILPDSCSGKWDVLVGGPSDWTSAGCVNVIPGASPYIHGCNSDRRCEVPKYPP